jgi:hypothetical protein
MSDYSPRTQQWFVERIGKRIYRDADSCDCIHCKDSVENGLIVSDDAHADYLAMIDHDFAREGVYLNYRDSK